MYKYERFTRVIFILPLKQHSATAAPPHLTVLGITTGSWHSKVHCKYSKCTIQNSYGFISADATVCALNKWLLVWF